MGLHDRDRLRHGLRVFAAARSDGKHEHEEKNDTTHACSLVLHVAQLAVPAAPLLSRLRAQARVLLHLERP